MATTKPRKDHAKYIYIYIVMALLPDSSPKTIFKMAREAAKAASLILDFLPLL